MLPKHLQPNTPVAQRQLNVGSVQRVNTECVSGLGSLGVPRVLVTQVAMQAMHKSNTKEREIENIFYHLPPSN